MKLSAKFAFWACAVIWALILLPYLVPVLNTIEPKILGLPFTVFWQYLLYILHLILCIVCKKCIWDPFETEEETE